MSRKRLEYAAEAFLTMMARSQRFEGQVKRLVDYPPEQRSMLMKCVGAAIKAAQPEADRDFNAWAEKQASAD